MYVIFAPLLDPLLRNDDAVGEELARGIGVHAVIARAWKLLIVEPPQTCRAALTSVCKIMCRFHTGIRGTECERYIEEFYEGAGGSLSDLASLVVQHLDFVIQHLDHHTTEPDPDRTSIHLSSVFLLALNNKNKASFEAALVSRGIVTRITRASRAVANRIPNAVQSMLPLVLEYLNWRFRQLVAYPYTREAIRAGLLHVIIACGNISTCEKDLAELLDIITLHTVYYVLSSIERALSEVIELQTSPAFVQSSTFPKWCTFRDVAQARIAVMKHYESEEYVSSKACENVTVSLFFPCSTGVH
ncbi:hypothetical protein C8R43DRAFT_1003397 [Mycena crocata]|nr:hypothetical protein C8R43DRAFT_1003397 [Mycena crocata]